MLKDLLLICVGAILTENFVLVKFLGICPFLGVSKKDNTALGMGVAVTFVMGISSAVIWLVEKYILEAFEIEYLQTITFILVIAVLVQIVEMFMKKVLPELYKSLGIYLPLITTNCAVLGVVILNVTKFPVHSASFIKWIVYGTASGLGFCLAILLFAGVRGRIENENIPKCLQGMPITLIAAGLLSLAFMGFNGFNF